MAMFHVSTPSSLCIELWRLQAIDDGRSDVRREPAQAQNDVQIVGCNALVASNVVHGEGSVLREAPLHIVGAREDTQEAHIG